MKINFIEYNEEADSLTMRDAHENVEESARLRTNIIVIADLNKKGQLVGFELIGLGETYIKDALKKLKP